MGDHNFRYDVEEILLQPKGGGIFEVTVNDQVVYSKKELGRFPTENEVSDIIKQSILK